MINATAASVILIVDVPIRDGFLIISVILPKQNDKKMHKLDDICIVCISI
jgi:hypothetical protein